MDQNPSGIKAWQWVVTVIVIIILVVIGIFVFGGKKTEAPITDQTADQTTDINNPSLNRIVMVDQYPGNVVYLSSVQFAAPGWIAIHKDNKGTPGDIIGSAYFDKGISPGKITLTQPTVEGGTYYAMMHTDDGDKKFDASKDAPLKDANGNVIMKVFHASVSANVEIKG